MLVRLITTMAGPAGVHLAGAEVDLPDSQAVDLCRGGFAVPLRNEVCESAMVESPPETTDASPLKSRRRKRDQAGQLEE
jgi:hypothetical protein